MTFPFANQADLFTLDPVRTRERRHWDDQGHERTEIRTGAVQCPKCGLYWPCIEEPDMWDENKETGRWDATGWWGGVVCSFCKLLLVEQPDGTSEAYQL